jgi:arginine decarboxylase
MIFPLPDKFFLVSGSAEGPSPLNSFDNALLAAGIGNTNLIRISSILPPNSQQISPIRLPYGTLIPIAYSHETGVIPGERVSAAVAVGIPEQQDLPGIIMEHHSRETAEDCEEIARSLVRYAFENRGCELKEIMSVSAEATVLQIATAFAGVVLWGEETHE